ncbi:molybdate ABC transporter permease subunit [Aquimarina brevivitae]|uniref:Molybdenum transport system permease n=1 Tax=Aquimarina brevivitae TaxID=323412 RepID=A0A4Q7P1S4_9FLAO|nr:molybdate ABC transporter permease subunit [Aquimarina brevivitae]RZS93674.1 molybdate transport system permease protein [Aquimarina brevivitae]
MDWGPILLSFKLAAVTTAILFVISLPISYWLAYTKSKLKPFIETFISLPLVLPPTVLGFYLLISLGPSSSIGKFINSFFDLQLVFSFEGLVFASILYSLPFMVQPIQSGLSNLPANLKEASYSLGKTRIQTLFRVLLPNSKTALLSGIVLSFAHTLGEFGVVLMIGGNIPDETRVASIAIYEEVEALSYDSANHYSLILLVITFLLLLLVYSSNSKIFRKTML